MSTTSLSRRSGIRGSSRAPKKINFHALPRPKHPTTLDVADEYASTTDPSGSSPSLNSEHRLSEEAREEREYEEDTKIIGEDEQDIHTRLLSDPFSREYRPSFDSLIAQSGGSSSRNAIPHSVDSASMKGSSPPLLRSKSRPSSSNSGSRSSDPPQHHPQQHQAPLQLDLQHFPTPPTHQHNLPASRRGVGNITIPPRKESIESYVQHDTHTLAHSTSRSRKDENAGGTISRIEEYLQFLDDDDDDDDDEAEDEDEEAYETPDNYSEADNQEPLESRIQRYSWWFDRENFYNQSVHDLSQEHLQYLKEHSQYQLHDNQCERNPSSPTTPIFFLDSPRTPRTPTAKFNRREQVPTSNRAVRHFNPHIETQETLKRERTRILQRAVVSTFRQIDWDDISNIKPLKKGGFGEIHAAEWSRLQVVLKRALLEESKGVEQFDQELEILKRVHDYDFIVPFYGVTVDPRTNVRCIVMKHCANGNLSSFLQMNHETLTWPERYRLSIEITKGLEFLHKSGFHHRDLHSGNILLDDKRTAMICDFGLSRSSSKEKTNDLSAVVGVASFMAPERFPSIRPIYSAACDVYSLGVIFWHISSGRIPFVERLRDPSLLNQLMSGTREEIAPGTPQEYTDLLVKCWDVNPAKRLKIEVIIAILQTLMARPSEPVHQMPPGFVVPSNTTSGALPMPPELESKMASLERASNALNKMVFDIKNPSMKETVNYIERKLKSVFLSPPPCVCFK
ncbi:kinase-like domain-containing protein [Dissophora ornata]|nr:kinase-like domain-containing protein [Dissophora ornata]